MAGSKPDDEVGLLKEFASQDDRRATRAFDRLSSLARERLAGFVRKRGLSPADVEDVLQEVFRRVWAGRLRYRNCGVPAWHGYLFKVARSVLIDLVAGQPSTDPLPVTLPDDDSSIDDLVHNAWKAETFGRIVAEADSLWLGFSPALSEDARALRLLAARFFYLDRLEPASILTLLRPAAPELTRSMVDDWLTDPPTIRLLAFETLHLTGESLIQELRDGVGPHEWSSEVEILARWRCVLDLTAARISELDDLPCPPEEALELLDRLRRLLPFESRMRGLLVSVGRWDEKSARDALKADGLWRRLAFEYWYVDELSQKSIHERSAPPARLVDFVLTPGMLNVWLSNRRLLKALSARVLGQGGDYDE